VITRSMTIGDQSRLAETEQFIDVVNPASAIAETRVPHATKNDVDAAVNAARHAFDRYWGRMRGGQRSQLLHRLADSFELHREELAALDTRDMGKPYRYALHHDIPEAIDYLRFYAGFCDKIRGSQIPCDSDKLVYTVREPVGVVAGILPWNFPLVLAIQKLAPALACGDTVILKPAEQSPSSALRLAELCLEVGFPAGVVNVITGLGETTGAALAEHPGIDKVSFTGSTEVGRQIMRAAADNIKKVTLELGGKTASIIFPDADLESAATSTAFAACYNTGQICVTSSRIVVNRRIRDQFLDFFCNRVKSLRIGDPFDENINMGPLVSQGQLDKVNRYKEIGAQFFPTLFEGSLGAGLGKGFYVAPTVFDHVDPRSRIAIDEIFGPVVSVMDFDSDDEALAIAHECTYGLANAVWTSDLSRAHKFASSLDSGFVWVNCNNYSTSSIPYEGHRQSGIGADMGVEVVESYTKLKSVVVNLAPTRDPWCAAWSRQTPE
jgi:acyl-CoA reductase-like NAD-dependent aldehyde dehydrogenase